MLDQTLFQAAVVSTGAIGTAGGALAYFRRFRVDRPAIGAFNGRDLVILAAFIVLLPVLYLALPSVVLLGFLVITFSSAMAIVLRPVLSARLRRVLIPALIGADIVVSYTLLGTTLGVQVYWLVTSAIVLLAAVGVSNLYVQGGLRLRQVAWFAIFLAAYDLLFTTVIPLTPQLAAAFEGRPLNPSIGFAANGIGASIGLGDLLVYSLFTTAAYKGFGRRGAAWALVTILTFGALAPVLSSLVVTHFSQAAGGIVIPAQLFFGPAGFLVTALLHRRPERTNAEWLRGEAVATAPLRGTRLEPAAVAAEPGGDPVLVGAE